MTQQELDQACLESNRIGKLPPFNIKEEKKYTATNEISEISQVGLLLGFIVIVAAFFKFFVFNKQKARYHEL